MNNKKNPKKTYNKNNKSSSHKQKNSNVIKLNSDFSSQNFLHTKKLKLIFLVTLIIFILLIGRLAYLQWIDSEYLKELAYKQQTINQIISPKRGTIYDSTGKILATSASVDTITINPNKIKDPGNDSKKTVALKELVAKGLSDIFELDYEETLQKVNSDSSVETIIKKVETAKVDELKNWMEENDISVGINIDEDTKRYYPYNTVLSNVLGACGNDNQGLSGIEFAWDSVLAGTSGKIVSSQSASQEEIPNAEETYIAAENGSDLTLTINYNIQIIVEKYLQQAVDGIPCKQGGSCIVMDPKTGNILAMATYPNYDLNNAFTPNSYVAQNYDSLSSEDKTNAIYKMWSNKSVAELYEPGSVFKLITASVALEENITGVNIANDFNCIGYENVSNRTIRCWADTPHGSQTLTQALENSCNPAFIQLGSRIGATTLYKYYKAFGLFDQTGIGLPDETNSIFRPLSNVSNVDRATMSFGQRFSITPLQMITAVSAIANNGILMQPKIVQSITNTDTGATTTIESSQVRQVISEETAKKVKSMMQSVVEHGTGGRAAVTGYTIGGKTGTSEPPEDKTEQGYVASYVAISPVEDTKVVLLLTLYDPPKNNHHGGVLAGPVVSQMLTEILPCLGVPSSEDTIIDTDDLVSVPEVRNKTIAEAEKRLKEAGFTPKINTTNDKNSTVVIDQVPKPGTSLSDGAIVMLYDQTTRTSTTVPDLNGKTLSQATSSLKSVNLNISYEGTGSVVSQEPAKGSQVDEGTVIKVTLKDPAKDLY